MTLPEPAPWRDGMRRNGCRWRQLRQDGAGCRDGCRDDFMPGTEDQCLPRPASMLYELASCRRISGEYTGAPAGRGVLRRSTNTAAFLVRAPVTKANAVGATRIPSL